MNIVDLNSLNGGVVLGAINAGCKVVYAACPTQTFLENFPNIPVGNLNIPPHFVPRTDIISMTLESNLEMSKVEFLIKHIRPRFVVGFGSSQSELSLEGYGKYGDDVIDVSQHGTPQERDVRVFVLTREDVIKKSMYFPMPEDGPYELVDSYLETNLPYFSKEEADKILAKVKTYSRHTPRFIFRGETAPRLFKQKYYVKEGENIRLLSPLETKRICGFPDTFIGDDLTEEISPKLAQVVFTELKDWI